MKKSRNARRNLADKLYQQKLKFLSPKCLVCGKPTQVIHHFVPKSVSNRLRYDIHNGVALCNGCHMRHHQAGDPMIHLTIEKKMGQDWIEYITKARYEVVKTDKAFYENAITKLENL